MSVSGKVRDEDKSAGYFFRLGVWPFFLILAVFFVTLFMFNLAGQLEGWEHLGILSEWYIFVGFFGFIAVTFVMAKESGKTYQTVVFDDPYRSWRDFLSVIIAKSPKFLQIKTNKKSNNKSQARG